MRSVDIAVNGVWLKSLSHKISIRNITESPNEMDTEYMSYAGQYGQRIIRNRRINRTIRVAMQILELYNLNERAEIIDAINGWAKAGYVNVSYRPGKRIYGEPITPAVMGNVRSVAEEIAIEFAFPYSPFWEDVNKVSAISTAEGTMEFTVMNEDGNGYDDFIVYTNDGANGIFVVVADVETDDNGGAIMNLTLPGTMESRLEATITGEEALDSVSISANGKTLALGNLSKLNATEIRIEYTEDGLLQIIAGERNMYQIINIGADDFVPMKPGINLIRVKSSTDISITASARGRWK